jgi:RHS repeat-associated protein
MKSTLSACLGFLLFFSACKGLSAQNYLYDTGSPTFSAQIPIENGFINVNNGDIHIEIPLATHQQRGRLQLNERLVYDSRIWQIVANGSYSWQPTNVPNSMGGWTFQSGQSVGTISSVFLGSTQVRCDDNALGRPVGTYYYSWTDPSGTKHVFNALWTKYPTICSNEIGVPQDASGVATDGSGYSIQLSGTLTGFPTTTQVSDVNGNQVYPQLQDTNGNFMSADSNGNLVDTLGRTPVLVSTNGNLIYYDVLGPGGARLRYTVTTETISYSTAFNEYQVTEVSGSFTAIQSIQLPDGSSYTFNYDSGTSPGNYGELTSVTLPTGGTIQYGYTNFMDSFQNQNRWVNIRVKDGGTTTFTPATISNCSSSQGCQEQVTVTSPDNNDVVYTFTLDAGSAQSAGKSWVTGITAYQGHSSDGHPLKSSTTSYTYSTGRIGSSGPSFNLPTSYTATSALPDTSMSSQVQTVLDWTGSLPTTRKEWDYYPSSGSAPSPTRETDYSYSCGSSPYQVTVKDASGHQVSQTTYAYDLATLTTTSGLPNHNSSVTGARCNRTSTQQWVNTSGSTLTSSATYDDTGSVLSATDPKMNPATTFTYQCSGAYPYQVTNALNQTTTYGYDCNSGKLTNVKDPNDAVAGRTGTTYAYESVAGRLQSITYPDGGYTSYSYPSPTEVDTTITATPDPTISSSDIVDSYGRKYQHIQAGVSSEQSYDSSGRVHCVTNPHLVGSSTDGSTCISLYDGLNRPRVQNQPDGNTLSWSYSGNSTTSINEASKSWVRTSDAFGRLTKVIEPGSLATTYQYNVLGDLTCADQWEAGPIGQPCTSSHNRSFVFDSLSRLTSATNPETRTIGYGYDANGNMTSRTDARGITANYSPSDYPIDTLNRVTKITYSDGSPQRLFAYDQSSYANFTFQNPIGRLTFQTVGVGNSTQLFSYDSMGRVINEFECVPSNCGTGASTFSAGYDLAGNMNSLTYPDGRVVKQTWDTAAHLQTVTFDSYNGQHVGYSYASGFTYTPSGALTEMTLGNGVYTHMPYNNRQQICQIWTYNGQQVLMDKHYFYAPNSGFCGNTPGNTGNIAQIMDMQNNNRSQGFSYDSLNRLTAFANGDGTMQQSYTLDSFGNMSQSGTLSSSVTFGANNQINTSGYGYDPAGNLTSFNNGAFTATYAYDANNQVTNVNSGGATYTYDADGERVRKDVGNSWTEYVYFNGQPLAEHNSDGTWSDYIYANGQRIARADSYDVRIHTRGTFDSTNEAAVWTISYNNYPVKSGDHICWRQWSSVAGGGLGINFTNGTSTPTAYDQDGDPIASDNVSGTWHNRCVDLSQYASLTIAAVWIGATNSTPAGTWDMYFGDISITSSDGTVTPLYARYKSVPLDLWINRAGPTNLQAVAETSNSPVDSVSGLETTTYYLGDQIGSARMLTSGGGWPVSSDTFYPFGQEQAATADPNHYKFTGQERDSESNLDYFKARHYSFTAGRFMSPDPYNGSMDPSNPQSFNRYSYVENMPLGYTDPTGLFGEEVLTIMGQGTSLCLKICAWAGPVGWVAAGATALLDLTHILGLWGEPAFHGSLKPRPNTVSNNGRTTCSGPAQFTAVGGNQAQANGALFSQYPAQAGGSIQGGTFGTVAVQKGFLGLSTRALRTFGTQIFVTPSNQGLISKFGGPTGPLSVSDYGDANIQGTSGVAFDLYRFPTVSAGLQFGRQTMNATISYPNNSGASCPAGYTAIP